MELEESALPLQDRRDDEAASAPLPRGQPVRRSQAGHPERRGGRGRLHLPGGPDRDLPSRSTRCSRRSRRTSARTSRSCSTSSARAFKSGGAEGFREIYKTSPGAFRYTAEVNEAFLGQEEHDLSELIVNLDTTIEALNQGEDLQDLVTNLRTVLGSFAAESESLEQAIAILPDVLREGEPALASLNASLPGPPRVLARGAARRPLDSGDARRGDAAARAGPRAGLRGRAARPHRRPSSDDPAPGRADEEDDPVPRPGPGALELLQRGRHPVVEPDHQRSRERGCRARSSRSSATAWSGSPARAARTTPTAPTSASAPAAAPTASRSRASTAARTPSAPRPRRSWAPSPRSRTRRRPRSAPTSPARPRSRRTSRPRTSTSSDLNVGDLGDLPAAAEPVGRAARRSRRRAEAARRSRGRQGQARAEPDGGRTDDGRRWRWPTQSAPRSPRSATHHDDRDPQEPPVLPRDLWGW